MVLHRPVELALLIVHIQTRIAWQIAQDEPMVPPKP
jgi:hypothetical protein